MMRTMLATRSPSKNPTSHPNKPERIMDVSHPSLLSANKWTSSRIFQTDSSAWNDASSSLERSARLSSLLLPSCRRKRISQFLLVDSSLLLRSCGLWMAWTLEPWWRRSKSQQQSWLSMPLTWKCWSATLVRRCDERSAKEESDNYSMPYESRQTWSNELPISVLFAKWSSWITRSFRRFPEEENTDGNF